MMFTAMTFGRLMRLCLKELRESLRDRRTTVTLLLMPLMVYPLLSLVLHRVIPTEAPLLVETSVRIGVSPQLKDSGIEAVILLGYGLLQNPSTTPVYVDNPREDRIGSTKSEPSKISALPVPVFNTLTESDRQSLRRNSVDLVVVSKLSSESELKLPAALEVMLSEMLKEKSLPQFLNIDLTQLAQSLGNYEVAYRHNDAQSERALMLVERCLAAVNAMTDSRAKRSEVEVPYSLHGTPISIRHGHVDLLATMIPLVLVLMTMAGAVYPAIDLTAGERERGTMEALVVSPTSPVWILFSKYTAVVTVALLTAIANLGAMALTLWISGVGRLIFGESVLKFGTIGQVLSLLILFTMFFAALLLAVTSFAKSFKEAQAYLIPLMLLALTPGVTSLMPGIEFTPVLATVPLVNIVLLAREVLQGEASWSTAVVTLICNCIYAMASLSIASRLFGASAAVQGSQGNWRDWLTRARKVKNVAAVDQMALLLAVVFPLHFICMSILQRSIGSIPIMNYLLIASAITWVATLIVPLAITWYQRIRWVGAFHLGSIAWRDWKMGTVGLTLLIPGMWVLQRQLESWTIHAGFGYVSQERMFALTLFEANFPQLPVWVVFLSNVVTPAICMELLFRGFVISSMGRLSKFTAIVVSALLYSLFDVLASHELSLDRFLPTVAMGLILGWLALHTLSTLPCIVVRILTLGVPQVLDYFDTALPTWQFVSNPRNSLPNSWVLVGLLSLFAGLGLLSYNGRKMRDRE